MHFYIRRGSTKGGAPVSTGTKKKERHAEAHVLVKTWKQSTAEYQPALAA
jgi:hypothetical protein